MSRSFIDKKQNRECSMIFPVCDNICANLKKKNAFLELSLLSNSKGKKSNSLSSYLQLIVVKAHFCAFRISCCFLFIFRHYLGIFTCEFHSSKEIFEEIPRNTV